MFASASYTTVALRVVHTQTYHPGTGSPAKVFGRGARGGRTFFQKGFPPRCFFLASNLHRSPAVLPSRASNLHQLPAACPARKIPPKKRLPTLGRSFEDDRPRSSSPFQAGEGRVWRGGASGDGEAWRESAARSPTKKSPADRGQKRPPRAESCKGVFEQSLAAAYFPT